MALVARTSESPRRADDAKAVAEMAEAAANFLAALSPDQQRLAVYLMKDEERRNFHFFPIPRRGVARATTSCPVVGAPTGARSKTRLAPATRRTLWLRNRDDRPVVTPGSHIP
jgi:hypothetical protein